MMARHISRQLQAIVAVLAEAFGHNARHMLDLVVESAARAVLLCPVFWERNLACHDCRSLSIEEWWCSADVSSEE